MSGGMTLKQAMALARTRVLVMRVLTGKNRRLYLVQKWSPACSRWRRSHNMTWANAQAHAKEAKLREVLDLFRVEDAAGEAFTLARKSGRWPDILRDYFAARKTVTLAMEAPR